jgi:dihydrofolate reductase
VAKLVYSAIASLDGYIEDSDGGFAWAVPSDEVHAFINDRQRSIGTHLYGRRLYETMAGWETDPSLAEHSDLMRDFARVWQAADKVVYTRSLERAVTSRTRIEREFDPARVQLLKESAERDLVVGGPGLATAAIRAGLVDEWHLYVVPVLVGGGKRWLPTGVHIGLELLEERVFGDGTVHLRYRTVT